MEKCRSGRRVGGKVTGVAEQESSVFGGSGFYVRVEVSANLDAECCCRPCENSIKKRAQTVKVCVQSVPKKY